MPKRTRVLIAHAPRLLGECLAAALEREQSVEIVGQVTTAENLVDVAGRLAADVLLLDPDTSGGGVPLVGDVCRAAPTTRVLALTHNDAGGAEEMMRAGARGYVDYNCGMLELVRCIERVRSGDVVVIAGSPRRSADTAERARNDGYASLTSRERQVLDLVVQGLTNADIAGVLCITNHTVKGHLGNILGKLGLQNRVQLTAFAVQHGVGQVIREPVRLAG